ncbi:MAG: hypothetical protein COC19_08505 [SAR86 cluster bacterium]|uniref:DUF2214 domain-containing protein n=1 Tax=SAR86 cluster bacterium TaxID=2030880 RepID=A0A2A4MFD4_9GAMM|nr:MAG: hypothetical protein COC19_08505 [SAR86 cluster bacterium]
MLDILIRYLHYIAVAVLIISLIIENMALKETMTAEDARNLSRVDSVLGLSAMMVFLLGLSLWLWVGKPSEFYTLNILFKIKLGLFLSIAALSIYPTLFFFKYRNTTLQTIPVPALVRYLVKAELVLLVFIPLLAYLMARGVGLPG